jgi:hypothetical protein
MDVGAFGGQGQVLDSCELPDLIDQFHAGPSERATCGSMAPSL